jgi:hypothetical protein
MTYLAPESTISGRWGRLSQPPDLCAPRSVGATVPGARRVGRRPLPGRQGLSALPICSDEPGPGGWDSHPHLLTSSL